MRSSWWAGTAVGLGFGWLNATLLQIPGWLNIVLMALLMLVSVVESEIESLGP
jgi:hypothetical protein